MSVFRCTLRQNCLASRHWLDEHKPQRRKLNQSCSARSNDVCSYLCIYFRLLTGIISFLNGSNWDGRLKLKECSSGFGKLGETFVKQCLLSSKKEKELNGFRLPRDSSVSIEGKSFTKANFITFQICFVNLILGRKFWYFNKSYCISNLVLLADKQ